MLTIFPEGSRSWDGAVDEFRSGFLLLVKRANVPVVPVAIVGADKAWHRSKMLFRFKPIDILFGEPITPQEMMEMGRTRTAAVLRQRIIEMKRDLKIRKRQADRTG